MLVGMIVIGLQAGSFDLTQVGTSNSNWVFGAFVLAFAIKSPLWPLHGWLPDAYRSAPPEVAAAAVGRGLEGRRVRLPADRAADLPEPGVRVPLAARHGVRDRAACTARCSRSASPTPRGVIAYSSIGQMGLVTLGIFALNAQGVTGAAFQMVNHGLLSAALFLIAGWRPHTTGADGFAQLGGHRPRPADPRHDRDHRRRRDARRAGLERVRVRVPGPARRVPGPRPPSA